MVRAPARGVALETIMGILRHADIKETLIYAPYSFVGQVKKEVKSGR